MFKNYMTEEAGASAAEYALILAIIGLGIVGAVTFLGGEISGAINAAGSEINNSGV